MLDIDNSGQLNIEEFCQGVIENQSGTDPAKSFQCFGSLTLVTCGRCTGSLDT